jgi:hypothetical protein
VVDVALIISGFGFLLEIVWSSLVVNPARALFYSACGTPATHLTMQTVDAKMGR